MLSLRLLRLRQTMFRDPLMAHRPEIGSASAAAGPMKCHCHPDDDNAKQDAPHTATIFALRRVHVLSVRFVESSVVQDDAQQ